MFKLVAFLFLIASPERPIAAFAYQETFASEKAREDYNKTAKSKASQKTIAPILKKKGLMAKFVCIDAKDDKSEDNKI